MTKRIRQISFYYLCLEEHIYNKEKNTTKIKTLNNSEVEAEFQKVYDSMLDLDNGNKAKNVVTVSNDYVIEISEYNEHILYAKIGQQNNASTVALRDKETLETTGVPMTDTQLLELFTFFMIDFETGVVAYVGLNGAPKLSAIRGLFDDVLLNFNIHTKLSIIMTDDVLNLLTKKDIISKITLSVAVPDDEILSDVVGLPKNDFDMLENVRTKTATYKLVAQRNKNILKSNSKLIDLITYIMEKFGDNLKGIHVNAKNIGESTQTYDLLNYKFTKKVNINEHNGYYYSEQELIEILRKTYNNNKNDLLKYINEL